MNKVELLSPAGDMEKLKIAIAYGADAVYAGVSHFSLRCHSGKEFNYENFKKAVEYAHKRGVRVYATVNSFPFENQLLLVEEHIKKLKEKLKNDDVKRLFENFASLFTLQGLNYILPLITFPYLVRVLGPDKYGLIAFAQAFIGYFVILTDYGFNLSATREVALNRDNDKKLSEIFSSVMIIKIVYMVLSFIILCTVVFSFEKFSHNWIIYIFAFGVVLGNVLFPVWFFQGMERMKV